MIKLQLNKEESESEIGHLMMEHQLGWEEWTGISSHMAGASYVNCLFPTETGE